VVLAGVWLRLLCKRRSLLILLYRRVCLTLLSGIILTNGIEGVVVGHDERISDSRGLIEGVCSDRRATRNQSW